MSTPRRKPILIVLGVLLAAVGVYLVLTPGASPPGDGRPLEHEPEPPVEAPALEGLGGASPTTEETDEDSPGLVVEVVDERSEAIAHAVVEIFASTESNPRVFWAGSPNGFPSGRRVAEDRTDAEGRVRLPALPEQAWILVSAVERAPAIRWPPPPPAEGDANLRVVLPRAHVLAGRVVEIGSLSVPGVLVAAAPSRMGLSAKRLAHTPHAVSDSDGRYRLEGLSPGTVTLSVARPGFTLNDHATVRIPAMPRFDVVLPPSAKLRGRVTLETGGRPLEGVVVYARIGNGWDAQHREARAVTDTGGRYVISGLPPVRLLEVEAEREGLVQTVPPGEVHRRDVMLGDSRPVVWDIAMRPGAFVVGTVRGPAGGLGDLRVHAAPGDRRSGMGAVSRTTADGGFRCGPLLGGAYEVSVDTWGYEGEPVEVEVADGETATATLTVEPQEKEDFTDEETQEGRRIRIHGVVRSPGGHPVPGARVGVRDGDAMDPGMDLPFEWAPSWQVVAGRDGAFEAIHVTHSSGVEVFASAEGYAPSAAVRVRLAPDRDAYLADPILDDGHTIDASVVDGKTGRPVAAAMATLMKPSEGHAHIDWIDGPPPPAVHAVADEDGRFRLEHVSGGSYRLDVGAPGYVPAGCPVECPAPSPIRVELQPALHLGGTLVFRDGTKAGVVALEIDAVDGDVHRSLASDERGVFLTRGLPAGEYTIEVDQPFSSTLNILEETLGPFAAGQTDLVITVRRGQTIAGRVIGPHGEVVSHAAVSAEDDENDRAGHLAFTDREGVFEVVGLGDRRVRLEVESNGYVDRRTDWLDPGARGVVVTLRRGGSISGVVVDEEGKPVPDLYIAAVEPENEGYPDSDSPNARTDAEGRFALAGILLPRVELVILQNYKARVLLDVDSVLAGTSDLRVVCAEGATISGVVLDERGNPLAGAELTAEPPTYGISLVARSDTKGRFTLTGLFPDRLYEIEVTWRTFEDEEEVESTLGGFEARGGQSDVVIRLE